MVKQSVLIVDDSAPMRLMLKAFLSDLAGVIRECDDGEQVLQVYAAEQPDWVLMDIAMKGVDGLTATRGLLKLWPQAQVVIVTSYDDDQLREEARQAGACGYVLKENLLEVRRLLSDQ